MGPLPSTIISLALLAVGLIGVFTMLSLQGNKVEARAAYVMTHKVSGYVFAALFLVMFVTMIWRVGNFWEESSARIALHAALSIVVIFLLAVKILVPRYFKRLSAHLFGLGITVYTLTFALVLNSAGYYMIWKTRDKAYISHSATMRGIYDPIIGKQLFIAKCSTCHQLDSIMKRRGPEEWKRVVDEMVMVAAPRIKPDEAAQILGFLSNTRAPLPPPAQGSLVEIHCLPCHSRRQLYLKNYSREAWITVVKQMNKFNPKLVPQDRIEAIVDYLVKTQDEINGRDHGTEQ